MQFDDCITKNIQFLILLAINQELITIKMSVAPTQLPILVKLSENGNECL